jgi:hypothetical protein
MPPERSVRKHNNELVVVRIHQVGDVGPFGCDFSRDVQEPRIAETFTSLKEAQDFADKRLYREGHRCDESCTDWQQRYIAKWFTPSGTVESCEYSANTPWEAGTLAALRFQRLGEHTLLPESMIVVELPASQGHEFRVTLAEIRKWLRTPEAEHTIQKEPDVRLLSAEGE